MANITAADVNKLRQITGAGMMDCKQALVESEGDFDKAIEFLRKKGQKVANKRADRSANEGIVLSKTNDSNDYGVIIMLNCETDFVAKNQDFINFANDIIELAVKNKVQNLDELNALPFKGLTIADVVTEMTGKTGEKTTLAECQVINAPMVFAYNHHGNRLSSMIGLSMNTGQGIDIVGKDVVMQVAAMSPIAIDKGDVDQSIVDKEIEIGKEVAIQEGKPAELAEKIAVGKLGKFFKESTLLNQDFIKDNTMTVKDYITKFNKELKITAMKRVMLGA